MKSLTRILLTLVLGLAPVTPVAVSASAEAARPCTHEMPDGEALGGLLASGQYAKLEKALRDAQRAYEENPLCEKGLWTALGWEVDYASSASSQFKSWRDARPDSYLAHLASGIFLREMGIDAMYGFYSWPRSEERRERAAKLFDLARDQVEKAISIEPQHGVAHGVLADLHRALGNRDGIASSAGRMLAADPLTFEGRLVVLNGVSPWWGGSPEEMVAIVQEAATHAPSNPRLPSLEGHAYAILSTQAYRRGRYPEALELVTKALTFEGPTQLWRFWRVESLIQLKKLGDALADLNLLLDDDPDDVHALDRRAWIHLQRRDFKAALVDAERAVELAPHYVTPWQYKASALEKLGRLVESADAYLQALERGTAGKRTNYNRRSYVDLLERMGRLDEASNVLWAVSMDEPRNAEAWYRRGRMLIMLENPFGFECMTTFLDLVDREHPGWTQTIAAVEKRLAAARRVGLWAGPGTVADPRKASSPASLE